MNRIKKRFTNRIADRNMRGILGRLAALIVAAAPLAAQVGAAEPSLFSPTSLADASWAAADASTPPQPAAAAAGPAESAPAAPQASDVAQVSAAASDPTADPSAVAVPPPATRLPAQPLAPVEAEEAEPKSPTLRREVTVVGEIVRIGDLIENAGAVADVPVFRAPDLGQTGSVPAARVLDAVRQHHIIWLNTRGLDEVLVTRASRIITGKEIAVRLLRALSGQPGLTELKDPTASFDNEVRTIYIEPNAELGIARLAYDPHTRRFDVSFDLPTSTARRPAMRVTGTVVETAKAAVALRAIAPGDVLKAADVMIERRPRTEAAAENVIGFAAKRALKAGDVIRAGDVMKPELVGRNETVLISFEAPGMVLSIRGKAMEPGTLGDVIDVLNIQSKRTIHATVSGPGHVSVFSTSPRLASNAGAEAAIPPR